MRRRLGAGRAGNEQKKTWAGWPALDGREHRDVNSSFLNFKFNDFSEIVRNCAGYNS